MASQENTVGYRTFTAGEALAVYRRVKLSSTAEQVVYADADDKGIGTVAKAAANAEHVTVRLDNHPGTRKVVCAAAVDLGDLLYGADDGKVNDVTTSSGPALYQALEAGSADGSIIEVMPIQQGKSELVYANLADSAQVENTLTETAFDKSKTLDGGELQVGDVLEVIARVFVEDNNAADTLNLKLYFGTEVIAATGAVDVADNDIGLIHAFIVIRSTGASGTLSASGVTALGVEGTVTAKPFRLAQATEDMSGDVAIAVKATWSAAHADNECELEDMIVIKHRQ